MDNAGPEPDLVKQLAAVFRYVSAHKAEHESAIDAVVDVLEARGCPAGDVMAVLMWLITNAAANLSESLGKHVAGVEVLLGLLAASGCDVHGIEVPKGKTTHTVVVDDDVVQAEGPREPS